MSKAPHGGNLRRGRFSQAGQIYLVTMVTADRSPIFAEFLVARRAVLALHAASVVRMTETLAFVVMPDHVHWLVQLQDGGNLGESVRRFKAIVTRVIGRPVWQRGFHDHALRADEDLSSAARYVIANPVRAGIVARVGDYPHWDAVWLDYQGSA